jgi:bifunctional ADP-heptose synthase (sugar kinase/adenylyltransferase)
LKEAAVIANQAAGIEVGKVGISPVELSELRAALLA